MFQNDFAGEVYMSLADVPGVDGDEVTGYEALSVVTLPLMHPSKKSKILVLIPILLIHVIHLGSQIGRFASPNREND